VDEASLPCWTCSARLAYDVAHGHWSWDPATKLYYNDPPGKPREYIDRQCNLTDAAGNIRRKAFDQFGKWPEHSQGLCPVEMLTCPSPSGVTQSGGSRYESGREMPRPVKELLRLVHVEQIDLSQVKRVDFEIISYLKDSHPDLYRNLRKAVKGRQKHGGALPSDDDGIPDDVETAPTTVNPTIDQGR
jgi:hypothetical protein